MIICVPFLHITFKNERPYNLPEVKLESAKLILHPWTLFQSKDKENQQTQP
jgi:hypothetical protein